MHEVMLLVQGVCMYVIICNIAAWLAWLTALSHKLFVAVTNFTRLPSGWQIFSKLCNVSLWCLTLHTRCSLLCLGGDTLQHMACFHPCVVVVEGNGSVVLVFVDVDDAVRPIFVHRFAKGFISII